MQKILYEIPIQVYFLQTEEKAHIAVALGIPKIKQKAATTRVVAASFSLTELLRIEFTSVLKSPLVLSQNRVEVDQLNTIQLRFQAFFFILLCTHKSSPLLGSSAA